MKKIIVVGGGAAGMLAAIGAAKQHREAGIDVSVLLLEKNEKLGKKIYITGKGRCNITNASDIETILSHITRNYTFMYSSIYLFSNDSIVKLLEENGCPTKVERGNRVFPVSDHSSDVISALTRALQHYGVKVRLHTRVTKILTEKKEEELFCTGVEVNGQEKISGDRVIVATGGLSYPSTGSTGDGYRFAKELGHTVISLHPGLVPFVTREDYIPKMQGLSLKNVKLILFDNNHKKFFEEQGEMLFTHFGISGPLVLSGNAAMPEKMEASSVCGEIDLKPALTDRQLDDRILRDFETAKNRSIKNVLGGLLPKKMIPVILSLLRMSEEKKVHDITKEERRALLQLLKHFPFSVRKTRGYEEAIITKGGINVKEIDPSNMESKKVKHLHFAGEVLDLDAVTGGYNLQIAWSTGYAAGMPDLLS